jgi:hypothetical protein
VSETVADAVDIATAGPGGAPFLACIKAVNQYLDCKLCERCKKAGAWPPPKDEQEPREDQGSTIDPTDEYLDELQDYLDNFDVSSPNNSPRPPRPRY